MATVATEQGSPRRPRISRKPLRREGRVFSAEPVCSCACFCARFAHETAGAARIRLSLRPLFCRAREMKSKTRANCAARSRRCVRRFVHCRPGLDPGPIRRGPSLETPAFDTFRKKTAAAYGSRRSPGRQRDDGCTLRDDGLATPPAPHPALPAPAPSSSVPGCRRAPIGLRRCRRDSRPARYRAPLPACHWHRTRRCPI
jgi:hypothetical protein